MTSAIGDYAVIGDGRTCALVAPTGSIDFLCWPRFDSDACLAALLGDERHGSWRIAPAGYVEETTRRYRGDTMILETVHRTDTGKVRLTDFMPWHAGDSAVVRIVEGLDGRVPTELVLRLRFGFGQVSPWMQPHKRGVIAEAGADRVVLDCPVDLTISDGALAAAFTVVAGDVAAPPSASFTPRSAFPEIAGAVPTRVILRTDETVRCGRRSLFIDGSASILPESSVWPSTTT